MTGIGETINESIRLATPTYPEPFVHSMETVFASTKLTRWLTDKPDANQHTSADLETTSADMEPARVVLESTSANLDPMGAVLEPTGAVLQPTGAVLGFTCVVPRALGRKRPSRFELAKIFAHWGGNALRVLSL